MVLPVSSLSTSGPLGRTRVALRSLSADPLRNRASGIVLADLRRFMNRFGLEVWEFDVIATLRRACADDPLTSGQLAGTTMVGSASMAHRIDRLVGRHHRNRCGQRGTTRDLCDLWSGPACRGHARGPRVRGRDAPDRRQRPAPGRAIHRAQARSACASAWVRWTATSFLKRRRPRRTGRRADQPRQCRIAG